MTSRTGRMCQGQQQSAWDILTEYKVIHMSPGASSSSPVSSESSRRGLICYNGQKVPATAGRIYVPADFDTKRRSPLQAG